MDETRGTNHLDGTSLEWAPTPMRPWKLRLPSGKVHKDFDTHEDAVAWMQKRGYELG